MFEGDGKPLSIPVSKKKPSTEYKVLTVRQAGPVDLGVDKTRELLQKYQCDGIDMEIGAIWQALVTWNAQRKVFAQPLCVALSAIKATSDCGDSKERDANAEKAIQNAKVSLVLYRNWLRTGRLM